MYRDQLFGLYQTARVSFARVSIQIVNESDTNCQVTTLAQDVTTVPATLDTQTQRPWSQRRLLTHSDARGMVRMGGYYPIHRVLGVPKRIYTVDEDFQQDASNAPAKFCVLNIAMQASDQSTAFTATAFITVKYGVTFFNRAPQGTS